MSRIRKKEGILNKYSILITDFEDLRVKEFKYTTIDWLMTILYYRGYIDNYNIADRYDLLIGPVADNNTFDVLNAYIQGTYGNPELSRTIETAIRLLEAYNLENQYCFKTYLAINKLKFEGGVKV